MGMPLHFDHLFPTSVPFNDVTLTSIYSITQTFTIFVNPKHLSNFKVKLSIRIEKLAERKVQK